MGEGTDGRGRGSLPGRCKSDRVTGLWLARRAIADRRSRVELLSAGCVLDFGYAGWRIRGSVRRRVSGERGDLRDPRAGRVTVGEWKGLWWPTRSIEESTSNKDEGHWRAYCKPAWETWPMESVSRTDAQKWVDGLKQRKVRKGKHRNSANPPSLAAETIHGIVHVMSGMYAAAMKETPPIVLANPFADLNLPPIPPRPIQFYEPHETDALYLALERYHGLNWRVLAELGMEVGLRPGEIYGLHVPRIDWRRALIHVTHVMTRTGIREYPKSKMSHRAAPVPEDILEAMAQLVQARKDWNGECTCPKVGEGRLSRSGSCGGLVFRATEGGPVEDGNLRKRIWYPAIAVARTCGAVPAGEAESPSVPGECDGRVCDDLTHRIRRVPPRIMRHTAASRLVQDGVPLYDVQILLGHESYATTQQYAHLRPDAHDRVRASWKRRRNARVTHEEGPSGCSDDAAA
jgi:integrase